MRWMPWQHCRRTLPILRKVDPNPIASQQMVPTVVNRPAMCVREGLSVRCRCVDINLRRRRSMRAAIYAAIYIVILILVYLLLPDSSSGSAFGPDLILKL